MPTDDDERDPERSAAGNERPNPEDIDDVEDPHIVRGDSDKDDLQKARVESLSDVHGEAWERTIEDMEALAADRSEEGWETDTVIAAHTDTVSSERGEHSHAGLSHVIPDNHTDVFTDVYEESEFTEFLAYGQPVETWMFLVTEFIDPDRQRSIFVASSYDPVRGANLPEYGQEYGVLASYFRTIDGTILGEFEHEHWEPLVGKQSDDAREA